ncbi:MAG: hypothetical protein ABR574_12375 [Cryomorphaceae bacterium]
MKKLGIVFLLLICAACKKDELPESDVGTPAFISDVIFDGFDYNLTAGENGLVLSPTYSLTDTSIHFYSDLSNPSCSDCGPAINIEINSPESFLPNSSIDWIAELDTWDYSLESGPGESSNVLALSIDNGNDVSQGNWFLDGDQINSEPSGAIDLSLSEPGSYEVSYQGLVGDCAPGSSLIIDFDGSEIPCYGSISQSNTDPNLFIAQPGPAFNSAAVGFVWLVDGTILGGEDNNIEVEANTVSELCVTIADAMGCKETVCYIPQNSEIMCANNLKINSSEIATVQPEPENESLVKIEFTDDEGVTYSSEGAQNNSVIQLESINSYTEPTRPNESFAEIVFEVSCNLYSEDGQTVPFSGEINMALALP